MNEQFSIGEIAVVWEDGEASEVEIAGPREWSGWYYDGENPWATDFEDWGYEVTYRSGDLGFEPEKFLRKRRPPPDWKTLSSPAEEPREVTCA